MSDVSYAQLLQEAELAGGGTPVPAGEYDCVVHEAVAVPTSNGKPMLKVKFKVLTGAHAGRIIFNSFVVSAENANALSFFFQHMAVLGIDRSIWPQVQPGIAGLNQVAPLLLGKQARVGGEAGSYNGRPQFNVTKIAPASPGVSDGGQAPISAPIPSYAPVQQQMQPAPAPNGFPAQPQQPVPAPAQQFPQPAPAPAPAGFPQQPQGFPPAQPQAPQQFAAPAPAPAGFPPLPSVPQAAPVQQEQPQAPAFPQAPQAPQAPQGFPPAPQPVQNPSI